MFYFIVIFNFGGGFIFGGMVLGIKGVGGYLFDVILFC